MPEILKDPRRARVSIALVFALHGSVTGTFATRIPWIQHHLDLGPGQLGLALVMPADRVLAGHAAGRADRPPVRRPGRHRRAGHPVVPVAGPSRARPLAAPPLPFAAGLRRHRRRWRTWR